MTTTGWDDELDGLRIGKQMDRIFGVMMDGEWRSLSIIAEITGDPEASISADLRSFRKTRYGGHTVNKRRRGNPARGWWEYQLVVKQRQTEMELETQ